MHDAQVRLSALIVNYRTYSELDACLQALARALDPARDEVIVIDHASQADRLRELAARAPSVRFVPSPANPGFGAGMNAAARLARGATLLLLNPDTIVAPGFAAPLLLALGTSGVGIAAPLIRTPDGRVEASARRFPGWSTVLGGRSTWLTRAWPGNPVSRANLLADAALTLPRDVDWVSGACLAIRRSVFESLGGFDEGFFLYWEDADLCRRAKALGWRVVYEPSSSVIHAGARASRQRAAPSLVAFHRSVFRYYLKHGGRARYLAAPIVYAALQVRLAVTLLGAAIAGGNAERRT